jgi:hypothetical protein
MALTATFTIISLLIIIFVGAIILYIYKNRQTEEPLTPKEDKVVYSKFELQLSQREVDNEGLISVLNQQFRFSYQPKDYQLLKETSSQIKTSLQLLKESKYSDILASREEATIKGIRALSKLTNLDETDSKLIMNLIKQYIEIQKGSNNE